MALREIPDDLVVTARLVVTAEAMERVADNLALDEPPTEALCRLMRDDES